VREAIEEYKGLIPICVWEWRHAVSLNVDSFGAM
jgi:hypothetical protein